MTITIHPEARQRLGDALAKELDKGRVQGNKYVAWDSISGITHLDASLPQHGALTKDLEQFVGEQPLSRFVLGCLAQELDARTFDGDAPEQSLVTALGHRGAEELSERLLSDFEALPYHYAVFVAIPREVGQFLTSNLPNGRFALDRIEVITDPQQLKPYPSEKKTNPILSAILGGTMPSGLADDTAYLRLQTAGFLAHYGPTAPLEEVEYRVRAFIGLLLVERIVKVASTPISASKRYLIPYRSVASGWELLRPHDVDAETSSGIASIVVEPDLTRLSSSDQRTIVSEARDRADAIIAAGDSGLNLLGACQWIFDSYAEQSELLAFVQATVAVEMALGDKAESDVIGLAALLGNRCAYLIAKSASQRVRILRDFTRIYDTRSKIVHRGKNRLSTAERFDLDMLRWICARVIKEELKLLAADYRPALRPLLPNA